MYRMHLVASFLLLAHSAVALYVQVALSATPADQQGLSAASNSSRRLFFAQASSDATEEQIKQWFSQYGVVESVQLLNDSSSGHSSGCGYITMGTSEQAAAALAAIQQNQQLPSPVGFLNVSYPLADELASAAAPSAASQMSSLVANADRTVSVFIMLLALLHAAKLQSSSQ